MASYITSSTFSLSVMGFVGIIGSLVLFMDYRRQQNDLTGFFALLFCGMGIAGFLFTAASIAAAAGSFATEWLFMAGHIVLIFALALFMQFPAKVLSPNMVRPAFYFFLLLAVAASAVIVTSPLDNIRVGNDLVKNTMSVPTAIMVAGFDAVTLITAIVVFIIFSSRIKEKALKAQSFVFALGLLVVFFAGPSHSLAHTPTQFFMADIFTAIGMLILLIGIFLPRLAKPTVRA